MRRRVALYAITKAPGSNLLQFQGGCEESADSPDALRDFDTKMEQQEATGRKLSRDHSTSKRSLWFRKSTKRQMGAPVTSALGKSTTAMESGSPLGSKGHDNKDSLDEQREKNDQLTSFVSRSIIPDPLAEVPAWFGKENDFAVGQTVSYRIKYPIHSPSGPRWYKNEHLVPSQLRPANRPPSVFSPSFPPMASSTHDSPEDSMTRPGLSRTPSGSPMATPDSSQADVAAKPRTRKTSQTTPDNVDLLDVTDPWGTHYHHPSPYDPGLSSSSPISPVVTDTTEVSSILVSIITQAKLGLVVFHKPAFPTVEHDRGPDASQDCHSFPIVTVHLSAPLRNF